MIYLVILIYDVGCNLSNYIKNFKKRRNEQWQMIFDH